jgi:hypothetical protein
MALGIWTLVIVVMLAASPAGAQELLTNGDFEAGAFTGWTVFDQVGGAGSFYIAAPGANTPISGFPTIGGPANGAFYAVSDTSDPGAHALIQTFTVPVGVGSVTLTFDMFVNDQSGTGPVVDPAGLDFTATPNQHARVDILTAAATPLDTGAGVVANLYIDVDPGPTPNVFSSYVFDITPYVGAGGTFQLRFAQVDNQGQLNQGVDNVSVAALAGVEVPTLNDWNLVLLASLLMLAGLAVLRLRSGT